MTKCVKQQALESIEAHAAHTISLIESNEMNWMALYFRIESIQTAARNALDAANKEEEEVDSSDQLKRAETELMEILEDCRDQLEWHVGRDEDQCDAYGSLVVRATMILSKFRGETK